MRHKKMPNSDRDAVGRTLEDKEKKENDIPPIRDPYDSLIQKILEKYKSVFDYLEKR